MRADVTYSDEMYFSTANVPESGTPSYTLVNARIGLDLVSGWQLSVWGKNLTDETYAQHSFTVFGDDSHPIYGAPTTYGVTAAYSF